MYVYEYECNNNNYRKYVMNLRGRTQEQLEGEEEIL